MTAVLEPRRGLDANIEQMFDTVGVDGPRDPASITVGDLLTGAAHAVPVPRLSEAAIANAAHPDSPVGRTIAALAADPGARHPLRRLEARIGRKLLDLSTLSDVELNEIAGLVLAEKIRRDARWPV